MGYFSHADGLVQHYGTRDSENKGRHPSVLGVHQQLTLDIVGTELGDAAVNTHLVGSGSIPAGAQIVAATLYVAVAFAGATAAMDIGVYKSSDLSAVDDDGIDAAIAVTAIDAIGDTIACDGALIKTILANDSLIAASYDTAAFTAGKGKLVVEYIVPTV